MAAEGALGPPLSLDDILNVKSISVVEAIDAGQLRQTLQWILERLPTEKPNSNEELKKDLKSLKHENGELQRAVADLGKSQASLAMQLEDVQRGLPASQDLSDRVQSLEVSMQAVWNTLGVQADQAGGQQQAAAVANDNTGGEAAGMDPSNGFPASAVQQAMDSGSAYVSGIIRAGAEAVAASGSGSAAHAAAASRAHPEGLDSLAAGVQLLEQHIVQLKRTPAVPRPVIQSPDCSADHLQHGKSSSRSGTTDSSGAVRASPVGPAELQHSSSTMGQPALIGAGVQRASSPVPCGQQQSGASMLEAASSHLRLTADLAGQLQQLQDRVAQLEGAAQPLGAAGGSAAGGPQHVPSDLEALQRAVDQKANVHELDDIRAQLAALGRMAVARKTTAEQRSTSGGSGSSSSSGGGSTDAWPVDDKAGSAGSADTQKQLDDLQQQLDALQGRVSMVEKVAAAAGSSQQGKAAATPASQQDASNGCSVNSHDRAAAAAAGSADVGSLGELADQLAQLRAELAGRPDAQQLQQLEAQLASNADAAGLAELQQLVASKAGHEEVQALRLEAALARGSAAASAGESGQEGGPDVEGVYAHSDCSSGSAGLVAAVQGLLAGKADRQQAEQLAAGLAGKADRAQLEELQCQLADAAQQVARAQQDIRLLRDGAAAGSGEWAASGGMYTQRSSTAAQRGNPQEAAAAAIKAGGSAEAAAADLASLSTAVELLAEAFNIMATGQSTPAGHSSGSPLAAGASTTHGTSSRDRSISTHAPLGSGAMAAAGTGSLALGTATGTGNGAGLSTAGCGAAVSQLQELLQKQQVQRKMDYFDPELLIKMAERLTAAEATLQQGGASAPGQTHPSGYSSSANRLPYPHLSTTVSLRAAATHKSDFEARLRRVAAEVRAIKDRLVGGQGAAAQVSAAVPASAAAGGLKGLMQQGVRIPTQPGDHAMLSSKPLLGLRCMACDRPLDKVDELPGPHLPTGKLPVTLHVPSAGGRQRSPQRDEQPDNKLDSPPPGSSGGAQHTTSAAAHRTVHAAGAAAVPAGGNWYEEAYGPPAAVRPADEIGPALAPGGWRSQGKPAEPGQLARTPRRGDTPMEYRSSKSYAGHKGSPSSGTSKGFLPAVQ